ncbi:MAG: ornithine carbamoyltransferase [Verrucomicrobia bacterium]|jgi:ornithine carbamoyltransferase|nr:ornithine carbamoyltransferase [Verrucomicrobiota bacterium]
MKPTSFLQIPDLSTDQLSDLLEAAAALKAARGKEGDQPLRGQTWALLFHKSSTRTRVSFEVGINELGGHAMILDQNRMQTGRGESIADTAKVLSRYLHGLIIRTYEHSIVEEFAREGSVPVINALTDALHPCQVVSDLFTLAERWGKPGELLSSLKGRKIVFYGDCGSNMAHSWILGGAMAGMEVVLCGPGEHRPHPQVDEWLQRAGLGRHYRFTTDPLEAAAEGDVLYTDVWVSMGDDEERDQRLRRMQPYQINTSVVECARPEVLFLHCLPAHPGEEVSERIYRGPHSIVFDQAENRLHAQKAILALLGKSATLPNSAS